MYKIILISQFFYVADIVVIISQKFFVFICLSFGARYKVIPALEKSIFVSLDCIVYTSELLFGTFLDNF